MRHSLTHRLPYAAADLFDLVSDVEAYPQFVRWIPALRTWNRCEVAPGVSLLDAEARVKFGPIGERFATRVRLDRPALAIDVSLVSGPFKRLDNRWRFRDAPSGSELDFEIDFEFRGPLLAAILTANFERAVETLVGSFEARAEQLYGEARCRPIAGS